MANFSSKKIQLFGPVFNQSVACTAGVIFFAFFAGERRQARSECEAPDKRDGGDAEKTTACPRTIVLLHSAPDIPFKGTVTRFCACAASWFTFFKIGFWWKNLPSTLRRQRKLPYQYSRPLWSILEVLNATFYIFVQVLSRKFEVIEEKCAKPYSLLLVFLQTDQMWPLMWFHWWSRNFLFCKGESEVPRFFISYSVYIRA